MRTVMVWAISRGWCGGFPGHQQSTWTRDRIAKQYYYHRFYEFEPDLDTANPEVREEIRRVIGYWLDLGVSGFRVDAVPFLLEIADPNRAKWETDFAYLYELRRQLQLRRGDAMLVGEANVPPGAETPFFGARGEGLQMIFNFWVNQHLFHSLASGDARPPKWWQPPAGMTPLRPRTRPLDRHRAGTIMESEAENTRDRG